MDIPPHHPSATEQVNKLVKAASDGDDKTVKAMLEDHEVDVNGERDRQETALLAAVTKNNDSICGILLQYGADVNKKGMGGKTPLHVAVEEGHAEILRTLLNSAKAFPCVPDDERNTPLMLAIKHYKKDCVRVFLEQDNWDVYMSACVKNDDGTIDTPMRLLIRYMPDQALCVMTKCISLKYFQNVLDPKFEAKFGFKFLDDMYTSTQWNVDNNRRRQTITIDEDVSNIRKSQDNVFTASSTDCDESTDVMPHVVTERPDTLAIRNEIYRVPEQEEVMNADGLDNHTFPRRSNRSEMEYDSAKNENVSKQASTLKHVGKRLYQKSEERQGRTSSNPPAAERKKSNISRRQSSIDLIERRRSGKDVTDDFGLSKRLKDRVHRRKGNPSEGSIDARSPVVTDSGCSCTRSAEPYSRNTNIIEDNHPLMIASQIAHDQRREIGTKILCHPLAVALVRAKWKLYGRYVFYLRLLMDYLLAIFLTGYVLSVKSTSLNVTQKAGNASANTTTNTPESDPMVKIFFTYVLIMTAGILLLKQVCFFLLRLPWSMWDFKRYCDIFISVTAFALVFDEGLYAIKFDLYPLAAICVFLAWFNVALTYRYFPEIGIFFIMFTRIISNSILVLLVFHSILLGFAATFSILLDVFPLFQMGTSVATILVMLSGEAEFADTLASGLETGTKIHHRDAAITAYVFFIVIMIIALLNLLVGIAVSDVETLYREAEGTVMSMKVEQVISSEFMFRKLTCFKKLTCWMRERKNEGNEKIEERCSVNTEDPFCHCYTLHPNKEPSWMQKWNPPILEKILKWFKSSDVRLSARNLVLEKQKECKHTKKAIYEEILYLKDKINTLTP